MKIYIIEDKADERMKAQKAIYSKGHSFCKDLDFPFDLISISFDEIKRKIEEAKEINGGIITDMIFKLVDPTARNDTISPSGLLVVIHALANGVPVVICTNASEVGGHHAQTLHWIYDGYIVPAKKGGVIPFGWIENKDWDAAVKLLEQIHAQQKKRR